MGIIDAKSPSLLAIGLVLALSITGVIADAALKVSSEQSAPFANRFFAAGTVIYAATAFAWVMAMKHLKLAVLGAVYSVSTALLLAVVGVTFFHEALHAREMVGIGLGVVSVLLLTH